MVSAGGENRAANYTRAWLRRKVRALIINIPMLQYPSVMFIAQPFAYCLSRAPAESALCHVPPSLKSYRVKLLVYGRFRYL